MSFLWTVQEEAGLAGARHAALSRLGRPRLAFNFDGGRPHELVLGATGACRMDIEVHGIPAHAGTHPERGVSAIGIAALAIARLQEQGWHGAIRKGRRRGTGNAGVIRGGDATNVVTATVTVRAEARSHERAFRRRIVAEYRRAFDRAARQVANDAGRRGKVRFDVRQDYESFRLVETEPCVLAAAAAVRMGGREPVLRVCDGGLDANWLNEHGIPAVTIGVGQENIHTVAERLDLEEFHAACDIALRLATGTEAG